MNALVWIGIGFCISQSAMFSGLNLAFFSVSRLRLQVEVEHGNPYALKVAKLREDSNLLLTTVLWGNVGINVLLTLLADSVMAGVAAFVFSTFVITLLGEIMPQAFFSRHALRMASLHTPVIRLYQLLLYPLAKPTALLLDRWLGPEALQFYRERDLRQLLRLHAEAPETDIAQVEGKGALNFLAIDDLALVEEGEPIDPRTIIELDYVKGRPRFPIAGRSCDDPFLKRVQDSEKKWVILTDRNGEPQHALNSDAFLRAALFEKESFNPLEFCHRPIIFRDPSTRLGEAIVRLKVHPERLDDDVIDEDIILFWGAGHRRIITGSDVLGRLLRGIVRQEETAYRKLARQAGPSAPTSPGKPEQGTP